MRLPIPPLRHEGEPQKTGILPYLRKKEVRIRTSFCVYWWLEYDNSDRVNFRAAFGIADVRFRQLLSTAHFKGDVVQERAVFLGNQSISVWPKEQSLKTLDHPLIVTTRFADIDQYHPRLTTHILQLEQRPRVRRQYFRGAGGSKIHHIDRWGLSEADLLHARALELFRRTLQHEKAVADLSWANVSRSGDYCMPHSHMRSTASVVYFLDAGDPDADDPLSGRFYFADPRLPSCCKQEPGKVTSPYFPDTTPGTMVIFPSQVIHCVNPYRGTRPRITLSWNINEAAIPGAPAIDDEE